MKSKQRSMHLNSQGEHGPPLSPQSTKKREEHASTFQGAVAQSRPKLLEYPGEQSIYLRSGRIGTSHVLSLEVISAKAQASAE